MKTHNITRMCNFSIFSLRVNLLRLSEMIMIIVRLGSSGLAEDCRRKQTDDNMSPLHWVQGALPVAKAGGLGDYCGGAVLEKLVHIPRKRKFHPID